MDHMGQRRENVESIENLEKNLIMQSKGARLNGFILHRSKYNAYVINNTIIHVMRKPLIKRYMIIHHPMRHSVL
jgi:hypothetical protein